MRRSSVSCITDGSYLRWCRYCISYTNQNWFQMCITCIDKSVKIRILYSNSISPSATWSGMNYFSLSNTKNWCTTSRDNIDTQMRPSTRISSIFIRCSPQDRIRSTIVKIIDIRKIFTWLDTRQSSLTRHVMLGPMGIITLWCRNLIDWIDSSKTYVHHTTKNYWHDCKKFTHFRKQKLNVSTYLMCKKQECK